MNIRELEALLKDMLEIAPNDHVRLVNAIHWCKAQQRAAKLRKAEFKARAKFHNDEQREMLR